MVLPPILIFATVYPSWIEPPLIELPALIEPNLDAQAKPEIQAGLATLSKNVNLEMEDSTDNEFLGTKYQQFYLENRAKSISISF